MFTHRRLITLALFCCLFSILMGVAPQAGYDPASVPAPQREPWWTATLSTVIITLLGLFVRWFEKTRLQDKVQRNIHDTLSRDSRFREVPNDALEPVVKDAFRPRDDLEIMDPPPPFKN